MSARASRKEPLRAIEGHGWRHGLIELQAVHVTTPTRIASIRCESEEEARATAARLLTRGLDLSMLRIVFDADRASARTIDMLREAS